MKEHRKRLIAAGAIVLLAVLYLSGVLPKLPDLKRVIEDTARALGPWTYALVGGLALLETGAFIGLLVPGEAVVIVGGVIAGQGQIELVPLIGLVWACCVLGDTTSFFIGRKLGRNFLVRHGPKLKISADRLHQVESYFDRHGGKTILIGRFIGLVRALAPFIAGSSGLSFRRFLPFSVIGCGVWGTLFSILGYVFYRSFDQVAATAGKATFAFAVLAALVVGAVYLVRRYELPAQFTAEVAGAVAVASVGAYVVTLYTVLLSGGRSTTPADRELLDLGDALRTSVGTELAKVVTNLGAFPTVASLVLVTAIVLASRRRFAELATLVTGAAGVYIGVHLLKTGIDRPRPLGQLVEAHGSSFPSGHAAYSTLWVAVALVVARALPGIASQAALVGAGLAISVVVGLSRIYLRVHYWSDVAGGWALGAAVLGTCAILALVVARLRHNPELR